MRLIPRPEREPALEIAAPSILNGQRRRWRVAPSSPDAGTLGDLPPIVAQLLARRGLKDRREIGEFLDVADSLFEDPGTLPDMDLAVERIAKARAQGETVAVYGDFDADGVTGTALLVEALRRHGVSVTSYIPHRVSEGHGLNVGAVDRLRERGVSLIVTVDCGVTDVGAIAHAASRGMDTIVTDHHLLGAALPQAVAIINPQAPHSTYAFEHLTGVGMTLKLAQAILRPAHGDTWSDGLMELAAIGTITDMAPLLGENRYIVARGIAELRRSRSIGLRALMDVARVDPAHANAETIGFAIGPRLNAAGRLDHADLALELLISQDRARADDLVRQLDGFNDERRSLTEETLARSKELLPAVIPPLIAVGGEGFNPGVVGLVAGKLAEEFGAPAVCYAIENGTVMGSCRTAPGFHWADALAACDDLLLRHGGHAQAAGFACELAVLPELTGRLQAIASEQLGEAKPAADGIADAEVALADLMGPTFQMLQRMEPFGIGNPAPVFMTRGVEVQQVNTMGADSQHFRMRLRAGSATWDAVAFRQRWLQGTALADIVYTIGVDHWNGQPRVRLLIEDYAPTAQPRLAI